MCIDMTLINGYILNKRPPHCGGRLFNTKVLSVIYCAGPVKPSSSVFMKATSAAS